MLRSYSCTVGQEGPHPARDLAKPEAYLALNGFLAAKYPAWLPEMSGKTSSFERNAGQDHVSS